MIDTPLKRPLSSLLRGWSAAGARITEIVARIEKPDEDDETWLYMLAESDPATAAFLDVEGLRRQPRRRSDRERWTS